MRIILVSLLSLVIGITAYSQNLKKVKVNDGKIKLKIPAHFMDMTPEDQVQRIPSVRNPIAAFTDNDRVSDLSVKISATQWGNNDVEMAKDFFKASIMNLFDRVDFLDEGIIEIKNNKYIYLEFESIVRGTESLTGERKYNFLVYHIKDLKTLVISFRCPKKRQEEYQSLMHDILHSIHIRKI